MFVRLIERESMLVIVSRLTHWAQHIKGFRRALVAFMACFASVHLAAQEAAQPLGEDLYIQGLDWMARNELDRARSLMERAIELNPQNAGARMDLSLIYCQLGEVAKANDMWAEMRGAFSIPPCQ